MMKTADLKVFDLFCGLDEVELAKILKLCIRNTYNANTKIFAAGQVATDICLLESPDDSVVIEVKIDEHGPQKVIRTLKKGEVLAWTALFPPYLRTVSARCLKKAQLICIDGKALINLMEKNNHIGYVLMRNLSGLLSSRLSGNNATSRREVRSKKNKSAS